MVWKSIDFQGIVSLDSPMVDLLNQYLEDKEGQLAGEIVAAIPPTATEKQQPPLPPPAMETPLKLSTALEAFEKRDYHNGHGTLPIVSKEDWNQDVKKIDQALWHYVEILESSATELFQQLEQVSLDQWHERLLFVVGTIREMLLHRMEDLIWAIRRLDVKLKEARLACDAPNSFNRLYTKISFAWKSILDENMITNLRKSQDFLKSQYNKFLKRYRGYVHLQEQAEPSLEKLKSYFVFCSLDSNSMHQMIKFYLLLKLWELNRAEKALPSREFVIALRNTLSIERATALLKEYYEALLDTLFDISLQFKEQAHEILNSPEKKTRLEEEVAGYQAETHMLASMTANYREFLLRADPDPYVRARLGFSEGPVGAEPAQTKPLLNLGYDIENMSELYERMQQALKRAPAANRRNPAEIERDINESLHEMGQPLSTYRMMRSKAEHVLNCLEYRDELSSFDPEVIDYVGDIFSKLLRADWKYNVAHGIPLFHQQYAVHQGLVVPVNDRQHENRLAKFKQLLNQVQDWVKTQKTQIHAHDIELDMNDIKGYLQDFLGYVQRICNDNKMDREKALSLHDEISQELLEYRYLFGNFFYQLRQNESEGQLIRRQLLFVDQYFESIEQKLYDLQQIYL